MKVYALYERQCWESWVEEIYLDKDKAEARRQQLIKENEEWLRRSKIFDTYRDIPDDKERWAKHEEILGAYDYRCGEGSVFSIKEWEVIE